MTNYIGIIHKDATSDYGVSFPDFPGCVTVAESLVELPALAEEVLAFHVEGLVEDDEVLPEPSSLDAVMEDDVNRQGVAILVPLRFASRTVHINITVPEDALREIDSYAKQHGFTRSSFLVSAARKVISESA